MTRPTRRVPDGVRPNVVARIPGASPRRLWILGHMDVVPPGELSYWKTDPWKVVVDGDKIRGRGVEDNQQAIVCGLLIAQELKAQGITPDLSLGLIFVSDEETSSRYGIHYILKTHADLFGPDDFVVVPDYGVADGSSIEISEKGQLWMRVEVLGHQCHASRPQEGRNSLVAAADMILHVRDLESIYAQVDPLFQPPCCTFVPTRHEENVPNINSLPGKDVFYIDCRILPGISHDDVLASAREIMEAVAERHGVTVDITTVTMRPRRPQPRPTAKWCSACPPVSVRSTASSRTATAAAAGPWPWASATWASPLRSGPASCRPIISPTNTPSFPAPSATRRCSPGCCLIRG